MGERTRQQMVTDIASYLDGWVEDAVWESTPKEAAEKIVASIVEPAYAQLPGRMPHHRGHVSPETPYEALPRVSGRPGAGAA